MKRIVVALAVGCGGTSPPTPVEVARFPITSNPDLDVLFLMDNTDAVDQHHLVNALPSVFAVLDTLDMPANLHIGVATSDLGTTGSLDPSHPAPPIGGGPGGCTGAGDDGVFFEGQGAVPFLIDIANLDGSRMQNFIGTISDALVPLLEVGGVGCGFEQHLAAARRALTNPANVDFIRPAANLGIVIVSDEDDCSVADASFFSTDTTTLGPLQSFRCTQFGVVCDEDITTPGPKTNCRPNNDSPCLEGIDSFATFFANIKPDPRMLAVAEIVTDPEPFDVELRAPPGSQMAIPALGSCTYTDENNGLIATNPAVRDAALLDALPDSVTARTTSCTGNLTPGAVMIGHALKSVIGDPCVALTPSCTVFEDDTEIPACPADGDCYEMRADPHACPDTPGNTRMDIHGSPSPTAYIHVHC